MALRLPFDIKQDINYSVRNMSKDVRTSLKPCTLVPIYFKKLYPHDKFDIDFATLLQSNPLVSPLMGEFVFRLSVFFEPDSNLYGWLDNNSKLSTEELLTRRRHTFSHTLVPHFSANNKQHNIVFRGSILDFIGFPPVGAFKQTDGDTYVLPTDKFCADRLLTYLDIIRCYYGSSQEDIIPYVYNNPTDANVLNAGEVSRDGLDSLFSWLRTQTDGVSFSRTGTPNTILENYLQIIDRGGLFCAQYEPDMLRNILFNVDTSKVNVQVTDNSFTIDTLRFQNKLQRLVDRYDISGGRFSNWLKTVWGSNPSKRMDIPQFLGTTSVIIDPNTITSTSNTYQDTPDGVSGSYVGELSGTINQSNYKGKNRNKNFHHYVSVDEPGTLCVIASLVPKVDYCQGIERELSETLFMSDYKPQFAQLGYQDVPYSDYSLFNPMEGQLALNSGLESTTVVGKQIAWMHLMSDVNRVHGEFSTGGEYNHYVLTRRYAYITGWNETTDSPRIVASDIVTRRPSYFADPRDWNYMFDIVSPTYDNFYLQVGINIRAVRPIGKRFMPNLE